LKDLIEERERSTEGLDGMGESSMAIAGID